MTNATSKPAMGRSVATTKTSRTRSPLLAHTMTSAVSIASPKRRSPRPLDRLHESTLVSAPQALSELESAQELRARGDDDGARRHDARADGGRDQYPLRWDHAGRSRTGEHA